MIATATKSAIESHGTTNDERERGDVEHERELPLRSLPIACSSCESGSWSASSASVSSVNANAQPSSTIA